MDDTLFLSLRLWLSDPDNAELIDPVLFFIPRLVDWIITNFVHESGDSFERMQLIMSVIKMTLGVLLAAVSVLAGIVIRKARLHHLWPMVILVGMFAVGSIVAPIWGQSVTLCAPGESPQDIPQAPFALQPYLSPHLRTGNSPR